jgi:hypothetical protein
MENNNKIKNVLVIFILLAIVLGFFLFVQTTVDDAYICFRYGYNLIHYGIWNYNADHHLIEAYTSFTYMILSVFPPLLNVQPQMFFKLITFIFFLLIIRRIYLSIDLKFYAILAILFFVANWQTHVHIYACLETIFWFWLLLETFTTLNKNIFTNKIQTKLWLIALLLPLTRPEGAVFSLFIFVYLAFIKKEKLYYPTLILFGLLGVFYFISRYLYFGLPLPLSFYHKSVGNNLGALGLIYNSLTIWQYLLVFAYIFYITKEHRLYKYISILVLFVYYFFYGTSALLMNYANRFGFQLFYPVLIFALIVVFQHLHKHKKNKNISLAMLLFVILITIKGLFAHNIVEISSIKNNALFSFAMQKGHIQVGKAIEKINDKNLKVMLGDAGVIPYIGKATFIDVQGLADVHLSRNKIDKKYFDETNADLVILVSFSNQLQTIKQDKGTMGILYNIIQTENRHTYIGTLAAMRGYYNLFFYIRNDSKYKNQLETELRKAIVQSEQYTFKINDFLNLKYLKF